MADLFRRIYDRTDGGDGCVSLEVSAHLVYDTAGTIAEARRLWGVVDRPNVMIKGPATSEGLPAIQQLICEGVNVNITLLFGLPRYREVAEACRAGLEARATRGSDWSRARMRGSVDVEAMGGKPWHSPPIWCRAVHRHLRPAGVRPHSHPAPIRR